MKLKIGNKVYVQRFEVAHILYELEEFPPYVIAEISDREKLFLANEAEEANFSFDCVFAEPASVGWLTSQEWILDFDEYVSKSILELKELIQDLKERKFAIVDAHNYSCHASHKANFKRVHTRAGRISNEIASLEMLIRYLDGELNLSFPKEYFPQNELDFASAPSKKNLFARFLKK